MRRSVAAIVLCLLAPLCDCMATDVQRTFPAAGVVRDQFVVIADTDGMRTVPAHAEFNAGKVTVSAQLPELKAEALVSVVVRFESGEIRSSVFERHDRQSLTLDPTSIAEHSEQTLMREIAELQSEQKSLSARIETAQHDLRKHAGFDKVDEIRRTIAAIQAQIDARTAAPQSPEGGR